MKQNQLRVYGIPENISKVDDHLKSVFDAKLELGKIDIEYSYRIGKNSDTKPRPLLVKFGNAFDRKWVFFNKRKFKGTTISITEELTKKRNELFNFAKEKLGKERVWTTGGLDLH